MTAARNFLKLAIALAMMTGWAAWAQEHGPSLRRENFNSVNLMVDSVYTSQLRAGNVNYRAAKTLTTEFSFLTPVCETARWQWAAGIGWKRREIKFADQPPLPGVLH